MVCELAAVYNVIESEAGFVSVALEVEEMAQLREYTSLYRL